MGTASSKLMCTTGINLLRGLQQVHVGNLQGHVSNCLATDNLENSAAPFRFAKDDLEERVTLPSPLHSSVFWGPPSCAVATHQDLRWGIAESIGTRWRGRSFPHGQGRCFLAAREIVRVRNRERTGYCQRDLKKNCHGGEKKLP
jgi:hypothetical protein